LNQGSHVIRIHYGTILKFTGFYVLPVILAAGEAVLPAWPGGPLIIQGNTPLLWHSSSFPIVYSADPGNLGILSHEAAVQLVQQAFSTWANVPDAFIQFQQGADLPVDVDGSNFRSFLDGQYNGNPIVFDADGSIIQALFGVGAEKDYFGFANPVRFSGYRITAAQAVFNGAILQEDSAGRDYLFPTILHELGHFIGLDHSQLFRHLGADGVGWNDVFVPIMLPISTDDEAVRGQLTAEDHFSLASLYPAADRYRKTGVILGSVTREGQDLPGVNVVARRIGAATSPTYSTVTGTYTYNQGSFEFRGLPPGEYQVYIEPIDPLFWGTSSVGRYAETPMGRSFTSAPPAQYYHASAIAARGEWSPIMVQAGQTVSGCVIEAQPYTVPVDELLTQLLGYNHPEAGAVPAFGVSFFQYLLVPSGYEESLTIQVQTPYPARFDLLIQPERAAVPNDPPIQSSQNGFVSARLGLNGDLPLLPQRYFIAVRNREAYPIDFTITAIVGSPNPGPGDLPTPTPTPSLPCTPTPTAYEVNPSLGLVVLDETGGVYPRGTAKHNFDIGISDYTGKLIEPGVYDGHPDPDALPPRLVFNDQYFPFAKDIEFTGERAPEGNGSEGFYLLIGGNTGFLPPVVGRLGATGGPNRGGIDINGNPGDDLDFGTYQGDFIPILYSGDSGESIPNFLVDLEPAGNDGFYVLDRTGRIYAEGTARESLELESPPPMNPGAEAVALAIYRGRRISLDNSLYSRDLVGSGAYILDNLGEIHPIGQVPALRWADLPLLTPGSPFRYHDLEWIPNPEGTEWIGLGVLRGDGIIVFVLFTDVEPTEALQEYLNSLNPFQDRTRGFSFDIARDFEVEISDEPIYGKNEWGQTVASPGRRIGIFLLDGFGGIHSGGRSTRYTVRRKEESHDLRWINGLTYIPYPIQTPYFGVDVTQDLEIAPRVSRP